jgi:dihydropyrimidine dehydrogenase (NAD+) subunit PreT|tara:strand:- start:1060 stop:2394 length:1335 start_codon:yes stop_codon:yes gene_type:complete
MTEIRNDIKKNRLSEKEYSENFGEIHPPFNKHEALVEGDRCYYCYDAPCIDACPTGINIPLFIRQITSGNPEGAAKTIFDENILGGMSARVCPTETLCQEACVRNTGEDRPVKIGLLQRYATDTLMEAKEHPYKREKTNGKRIAIVGGGPAGLSCAHRLAMKGYSITIFDSKKKLGGLNEYGIAAYKSLENFAERETKFVLSIGGIEHKLNSTLGKDITLEELQNDYDAVFLGLGLSGVNHLRLEGENSEAIDDAVNYIEDLRQSQNLADLPVGRKVVVIGGGMTAIDMAVQIKKLGSEEVTIVYRRGQKDMSASIEEQQNAQNNGVLIRHWSKPSKLLINEKTVNGVEFEYTENKNGKLVSTGEKFSIKADMVFRAIGQTFESSIDNLPKLENGRILVDNNYKTTVSGIWAGGDCVKDGEDLTVSAVEAGKIAANSIHNELVS